MRFTSLVVELIRARPRLVVWIVVLCQSVICLGTAVLFYRSPPGDVALVLAFGREYQVGTTFGPPLPFWLADIAYRAVGNHTFGIYLLAQGCTAATFWILFLLGRQMVGAQHAVLAVLLTMTISVFGPPGLEFGPDVLARPIWALLLFHSWLLIGQGRRNAWFAFAIEAGLLLLTTTAALPLLVLLIGFALATERGRRMLLSFDPLLALLVIVALALPYLVWLVRTDAAVLPQLPAVAELGARAAHAGTLLAWGALAAAVIPVLVILNTGWFSRTPEEAPIIYRPPIDPLARNFVYCFALVPPLAGSLLAGLFNLPDMIGGRGVALLLSGLLVVIATGDLIYLRRQRLLRSVWAASIAAPAIVMFSLAVLMPWIGGTDVATSMPARRIAQFFGDSFQRRTNQPLPAVAGDPRLASLVAMGSRRPHLFLDGTPAQTPWATLESFNRTGGIVVWRSADTVGAPPPDIARRFPGLQPEVPQSFDWLVNGRQNLLRVGWAIVRPKAP